MLLSLCALYVEQLKFFPMRFFFAEIGEQQKDQRISVMPKDVPVFSN